ncbi:hypothetical protein [Sphingomonas sp. 1P08PE]|uniref:hypothetical protein n=1 Tax=Sphingomonas sp. 1P08PE TaxID=554122 RepID=UPI0039A0141B
MRIRPPAFATADLATEAAPNPAPVPRLSDATRDTYENWIQMGEGMQAAGLAHDSRRADGWTCDRQRTFLAALAEGSTVEAAAALVGLSPQSAYGFRQRAHGAAFALGWRAALLLQRDKLVDTLTSRAFDGQVDTFTRADGTEVTRHRHDNRLALALLSRLDRIAERDDATDHHGEAQAQRIVAGEWQRYLDMVAADATPARIGLFLAARAPAAVPADGAAPAAAPDPVAALAPVLSLARADLYLRTGVGDASEVDIADLDPATRADWTADQWRRAEAAGLLALAPAPAHDPQLPQHSPAAGTPDAAPAEADPVWYDERLAEWRTAFPVPPGEWAQEWGRLGERGYHRSLTEAEEYAVTRAPLVSPEWEARRHAARRAWFVARQPAADPHGPAGADWLAGQEPATEAPVPGRSAADARLCEDA